MLAGGQAVMTTKNQEGGVNRTVYGSDGSEFRFSHLTLNSELYLNHPRFLQKNYFWRKVGQVKEQKVG